MEKETIKLKQLINQAMNDVKDPVLKKDFKRAVEDLDDGKDIKVVTMNLDGLVSTYLMLNEYDGPESLIELGKHIQNEFSDYWVDKL